MVRLYRDDTGAERALGDGVWARPLVNQDLAGVAAGYLERISLAPGASLELRRGAEQERWFFVAAGRGAATVAGDETAQPLAPYGLLWLGEQPCRVANNGPEPLVLVEVSTSLGEGG